jgi:hypothetical protein
MLRLERSEPEMPSNVAWFERLMYLDIGISVLILILEHGQLSEEELAEIGLVYPVVSLLYVGFLLLLIWLTVQLRMNWARWTLLALFILSDLSIVYDSMAESAQRETLIISLLNVVTFGLEIAAFYLIFTGNARDWFKKQKPV